MTNLAVTLLALTLCLSAPVLAADLATQSQSISPAVPARSEWAVEAGTSSVKTALGSLNKSDGYLLQAELITEGASINTIKLTDYFGTVDDDRLYKKVKGDEAAYEATAGTDRAKYHGHYSLLNPLPNGTLPLQTLNIWVGELKFNVGTRQWKISPQPPTTQPSDSQTLEMTWTLLRDANFSDASKPADLKPYLRLTKIYTVKKGTYSVAVGLKVENLSGEKFTVSIQQAGPCGVPEEPQQTPDLREGVAGKWSFADQKVDPVRKKVTDLAKLPLDVPLNLGSAKDGYVWIGQANKYFGSMLYLMSPDAKQTVPLEYRAEYYFLPITETQESRTWATGLRLPDVALDAGAVRTMEFDLFAGPKQRDMLQDEPGFGGKPLYKELNYRSIIDLSGSCTWCTFDALTFVMMWLLEKFAWLARGNYGIAIILLVILVRVLLHPLTKKSQVSMMKMQKLAPEMAKIKEKYANDKEALNREMMGIYKKQGPASMLGCLPMFLQMPIWIALWTALSNSIELRHAAFLPVWITDLSAPDRLLSFSNPLIVPFIGWKIYGLNLLPLLLTVAMFLQTKLAPTQVATTPEAQKQQKMMLYMMPVMMLLIFYAQPSGLNLYIMASTFAGVGEQYVIRKHIRQKEAQEAADQRMVAMPGRGPRGKRSRKPKGPFWTKQ